MIEDRIKELETWYSKATGTITAFSGGVDSSLVLYLSKKFLPERTIGCIAESPSLKRSDLEIAQNFCHQFEIPLEIIHTSEIEDTNYNSNPADRCFYCKNHLYMNLEGIIEKYPGYIIINGTNSDDLGDYRPGLKAATDHAVRSPLAECRIGKNEVRELAHFFSLPTWDKPASPCLSSRIPYGEHITPKKLKRIELAESLLNKLGFTDVRVRHRNNTACIEVPESLIEKLLEKYDDISIQLIELGFEKCVIDEEGLISGKLNRDLIIEHGRPF